MFKKRVFALALSCVMAVTLLSGLAFAAANDNFDHSLGMIEFSFSLPAKGDTKLERTAVKRATGPAHYEVDRVYNPSGMFCYLNVRSADGTKIVGNHATISGGGPYYVSYRTGYGIVNTSYRPSGQTDTDSAIDVWLYGAWHP